MDSPHESFEPVRRLLALKRHEQPPPGYFDYLHTQVLDRLTSEAETEPEDWLETILERFRLRPALAGVFSFALGAFYLFGLGYSGRLAPGPAETRFHFEQAERIDRRPLPGWEPWVVTVAAPDLSASSIAPVIQAGPPASVHSFVRPGLRAQVSPASYVIPAP